MNYSKVRFVTDKVFVSDDKKTTIAVIQMYVDDKLYKEVKGKATLNTTDAYDEHIGQSLAEARAKRKLLIEYRNEFRSFVKQSQKQVFDLCDNLDKLDKILVDVTSDIKYFSK